MDFSDFSEFIGPIIFGLIAWLSNYFSKKKKPPKDGERDNINQNENDKTFQSIFDDFNKEKEELSDRCENLTSIPGIGAKNCNNFYEAGYMTPESIISASDEELLTIPGVGISFVKKLRKTLGRI